MLFTAHLITFVDVVASICVKGKLSHALRNHFQLCKRPISETKNGNRQSKRTDSGTLDLNGSSRAKKTAPRANGIITQ